MTPVGETLTAIEASHGRPAASPRDDLVTTAFGVWLVLGVFTDGWAHVNLPGLETFFTPWHGVLYSGFTAGAAWLGVLALRGRRLGLRWARVLPIGYPLAAAGVLLFGAGGVGDMAWHVALGVETGIDALLSPTHLVLLTGAALALTAALRSGWARPVAPGGPSLHTELPAVLSLSLVTALAAFFLQYVSVFTGPAAAGALVRVAEAAPGHEAAELATVTGLAGYVVTTVLLVAPVLLAQRIGRRPRGAVVLLVAVVAGLSAALADFTAYGVTATIAVIVAALAAEAVAAVIERSTLPRSARLPAMVSAVPALLWPAQLLAVALTEGVRWPAELWSGVVVLSALVAAALGVVAGWVPTTRLTSTDAPAAILGRAQHRHGVGT